MRIATWNVNGIGARIDNLCTWLEAVRPDVCCLQEIKCADAAFPRERIEGLGYNVAVNGQKGFNGVAILSRRPIEDARPGLPGDDDDAQARYLEAVIPADGTVVRVASLYLPNGNPAPGEKYDYKLAWMDRLTAHARDLLALEEPVVLAGDYNVIPDDADVHDPEAWRNDALFLPESRARLRRLEFLGFTDALRATTDAPSLYTFWDYQAGAWQKNNGIRIDHLLLSPQAADRLRGTEIDRQTRAWERPSDHVPVVAELDV